jgi:hypothetical protein
MKSSFSLSCFLANSSGQFFSAAVPSALPLEEWRMQGSIPLPPNNSRRGKKKLSKNNQKRSYKPVLEPLEDRITPYALSGYSFANTSISASFMPDGTWDMGYQSNLFALYNASYPTATWQLQFAKALQTWADASSLNFHFVTEQIDPSTGLGYPSGTAGTAQGDPRFGDIRLASSLEELALGTAWYPSNSSTIGGDITLPGNSIFALSSNPNLYSVLLHQFGCALGLSEINPAAPYSVVTGTGPYTGLYPDDIAGIQALYGTRPGDLASHSLSSPTPLILSSGGVTLNDNLDAIGAQDYYQVTEPASSNGTLTVSVDARNLSLFQPKVAVFDAAENLLTTASATIYGSVAAINLSGLLPGHSYILEVVGATNDVFGMGAYKLTVRFGGGKSVIVNAPSGLTANSVGDPQINLAWTNNAANPTGNVVDRSTDGVNWTQIASLPASSISYADTMVADGLTYYYQVYAVNGSDSSNPSNTASVTLAPLAPSGLTASAVSANQINLSWSDVIGETGFTVERSLDGVNWTQLANTPAGVTSYQDVGLAGGTTYFYEVFASNGGGNSANSTQASASTIPTIPTGLTAAAIATSQINLVWNDVAGETGFFIERSSNGVTWTQIAKTASGITSYLNIGLGAGHTYWFRVRAYNAAGISAASEPVRATTLLVPLVPTGLTATGVSTNRINLAWNGVPGVTGYQIFRWANGYWYFLGSTLAGVVTFANTGLGAGHTFLYRIRACAAGRYSACTPQVSACTVPLPPPKLSATAVSSSQVNLAWSNVYGETGFQIERSPDGFNWTMVASTAAHVTTFQDSGLSPTTTYYYRVRATNGAGTSAPSSVVSTVMP